MSNGDHDGEVGEPGPAGGAGEEPTRTWRAPLAWLGANVLLALIAVAIFWWPSPPAVGGQIPAQPTATVLAPVATPGFAQGGTPAAPTATAGKPSGASPTATPKTTRAPTATPKPTRIPPTPTDVPTPNPQS